MELIVRHLQNATQWSRSCEKLCHQFWAVGTHRKRVATIECAVCATGLLDNSVGCVFVVHLLTRSPFTALTDHFFPTIFSVHSMLNIQRRRTFNLVDSVVEENVGDFGHRTNIAGAWVRDVNGRPWHD